MTTSSHHSQTSKSRPYGDHWSELAASISSSSLENLDKWFDEQLKLLESRNEEFVTKQSLRKNLRG